MRLGCNDGGVSPPGRMRLLRYSYDVWTFYGHMGGWYVGDAYIQPVGDAPEVSSLKTGNSYRFCDMRHEWPYAGAVLEDIRDVRFLRDFGGGWVGGGGLAPRSR